MVAWGDSRFGNSLTDTNDIVTTTVEVRASGPAPAKELAKADAPAQSVLLSQLAYPGGGESISVATGMERRTMAVAGTKVVIANQSDAAAALAGSVLARANDGPLLLSAAKGLSKDVSDEVKRLHPTGAYILGSTAQLPSAVEGQLAKTDVPQDKIVRIDAAGGELARQVAAAMDIRSEPDKTARTLAFDGAVVVNPATREAASATALAASLRLPILFVDQTGVPTATSDALAAFGIQKTIVVGGTAAVGDAGTTKLPSPTRLGGTSSEATADAVAKEMKARGLPTDVTYAATLSKPVEAAALGAAVARLGGMMVLAPAADATAARQAVGRLAIASTVDRVVVVRQPSAKANTAVLALEAVIGLLGLGLLIGAAARSRRRSPPARTSG